MRLSLLLCCSLIGLSLAAMTDEQLVYGLVKLYNGMVYRSTYMSPGDWVHFIGSMMGWHIGKNRATSVKFRVMEGLANIERALNNELGDHFATYNFTDPIDMEPYYTVFHNDSLSHLYLDNMWQTYQQVLVMRWADARTELERVILSTETAMSDIPSTGLTGYRLMADGFDFLARLTSHSDRLASEIQLLKCKAELIDANIPNHLSEFASLQKRIVYTCLRRPKIAQHFQGALNNLKVEWLDADRKGEVMRTYQCCMKTHDATSNAADVMADCITRGHHFAPCYDEEALQAAGPLNKTLFYHSAADFSRYYNVYRHSLDSENLQKIQGVPIDKPIRSFEPYEVIHELYTDFFESMNVTECAKPKLDQLLANSKLEVSSSTKFQTVYDDLVDLFESCWRWKF